MTARAALAGLLALAALACAERVARVPVHEVDGISVLLRGPARPGPEAPAYAHPAVISQARVAHILSRLDIAGKGGAREPAIASDLVYPLAAGVSRALGAAAPHQEVVATAVERERRLGLFTHDYLTSFVAFVEGGQLHIHLSRVHWEIPRGPNVEIPEPRTDRAVMKFRVLPGRAVTPTGPQRVAVDWRDAIFDAPTALKRSPFGATKRRTILLEDGAGAAPGDAGGAEPPSSLAPETLRALADLEAARRRGALSEAEYQARRREILLADPGAP